MFVIIITNAQTIHAESAFSRLAKNSAVDSVFRRTAKVLSERTDEEEGIVRNISLKVVKVSMVISETTLS